MFIVDSHCHLNFDDFANDFSEVLNRAEENGVKIMQTICTRLSEFEEIKQIAEKYSNIYCSVGVHPCNVIEAEIVSVEKLLELSNHSKVIGFGETGLDYYHEPFDKDKQIQSFKNHIEAARLTGKPVIIHTRDAEEDTINILREEMKKGKFKGLLHCFTGTQNLCEAALELGIYISVSGIITFKNAKELQATIKNVSLKNLLVETDAPYLAPTPHRGKRNEPGYTKHVVEFLAGLKEVDVNEVAEITTKNFKELFNIV
ncbi:MAG: TatD family hydrolase [Sphingobacteriia bacterium]|nr:TatD family hydrolase [Sphingobacteriia bacterium]